MDNQRGVVGQVLGNKVLEMSLQVLQPITENTKLSVRAMTVQIINWTNSDLTINNGWTIKANGGRETIGSPNSFWPVRSELDIRFLSEVTSGRVELVALVVNHPFYADYKN